MARSPIAVLLVVLCIGEASRGADTTFTYHERLIFLEGKVNGSPVLCLLDTGANVSAIDGQLTTSLGLKPLRKSEVTGTMGTVSAEMVSIETLELGGQVVRSLELTSRPIQHGATPQGRRLDVIVGSDFLRHFVVTIDFDRRTIKFGKHGPGQMEWLEMNLGEGIPNVPVELDGGLKSRLRIDSGSGIFESEHVFLNLTRRDERLLRRQKPERVPASHVTASGVGGETKMPVYVLEDAQIGTIRIKEPRAIIQAEQGYFARSDAMGFFGNNLLEKYSPVCLDYPKARLGLTPPGRSEKPREGPVEPSRRSGP